MNAQFWGVIDAGGDAGDDGVEITTNQEGGDPTNGTIDVTLHQGANIVNTGGDGLNLTTDDGNINATINSQLGTLATAIGQMGVDTSTSNNGNTNVVVGTTGAIFSNNDSIFIEHVGADDATDGAPSTSICPAR